MQTTSEVTALAVSEEVTITEATEATSSTEPISDPEALIGEYLDYFEKNKDDILYSDTEKYRIHFYQTYGSDEPEMVVERISQPHESGNDGYKRVGYYNYHDYYTKSDDGIALLLSRSELYEQSNEVMRRTMEYSSSLLTDCNGNYYEWVVCNEKADNGTGMICNSFYLLGENSVEKSCYIYYADTLDDLLELYKTTFADYNHVDIDAEIDCPSDWNEDTFNRETGKYEFFVFTDPMIKAVGDVEVLEYGPFSSRLNRVSEEDYYSGIERLISRFTEVSDTVKYSSEWMGADVEVDKAKIIKGAGEALSAEDKTAVPEALIGEYLDYFESNKNNILTDDTEKYRLSFFQAADRQTGMMVEISSGAESTVERRYYGKSDKAVTEIPLYIDSCSNSKYTNEYAVRMLTDAAGEYYEYECCDKATGEGVGMKYERILKPEEMAQKYGNSFAIYYSDTAERLFEHYITMFAYEYELHGNTTKPSCSEEWKNEAYSSENDRYEFYVFVLPVPDVVGDYEYLDSPPKHEPFVRVSRETFNSAREETIEQFTDVTDCVKYSSEWMGADVEVDKAEIIKGACGVNKAWCNS